ncbi:MAG: hypothetical protein EAZ95_11645 [Bacteroidetes bacterium]|nr:MAG: hypothetical protein EAZ95_11645 [Bacteroidota bacterium]
MENQTDKKILGWVSANLLKRYANTLMKRFFHPKMHGLLKATLTIDANLPVDRQGGIFQPNKEYKCWLRLSSSSTVMKADIKKNFRGFVLKALIDGQTSQDFFAVNIATFQAKDVTMLTYAMRAVTGNLFNKLTFLFRYFFRFLGTLKNNPKCYNLLETRYWSQTPFALGESKAIKYSFVPHKPATTSKPMHPSYDFLREQLRTDLNKSDALFDLMIQFRTNPEEMSIEDSSKEWHSEWHKVGTVCILKQEFDTEARRNLGEIMAFSPWNTIPEHQPLGQLNAVRKMVYEGARKLRHQHNHVAYIPPTPQSWEQTS